MASKRRRIVVTPDSRTRSLVDLSVSDLEEASREIKQRDGIQDSLDDPLDLVDDSEDSIPWGSRSVPPSDEDPSMLDAPSMSVGTLTEAAYREPDVADLSDNKIRHLEDFMALFPFDGSGRYQIKVTRIKPRQWGGYDTHGTMRPVIHTMTMPQFTEEYGGGEYELTVYGPPTRGGGIDPRTGQLKPKSLTSTIKVVIPYDSSGGMGIPPNIEAVVPHDETDWSNETMDPSLPRSGMSRLGLTRPASAGDASIHAKTLEHESRVQDAQSAAAAVIATQEADVTKKRMDIDASINNRALDILERNANEKSRGASDPAEMLRALAPFVGSKSDNGDQIRQIMESHKTEMSRLVESQKQEMIRIGESHDREREALRGASRSEIEALKQNHENALNAIRASHEESIRVIRKDAENERDRTQRAISDGENRLLQEKEVLLRDSERSLTRAIEEGNRRLADLDRSWTLRIDAESKAHEREIRQLSSNTEVGLSNNRTILESQIAAISRDLAIERDKNKRLEEDLKEKSDLPSQLSKFATAAEAMGFAKADQGDTEPAEANDWKSLAASILPGLAAQLPEILRSSGDIIKSARGVTAPAPAPAAPQQHQPMLVPNAPPMEPRLMPIMAHHGNVAPLPVSASMYPPPVPMQLQQQPVLIQPVPVQQPQYQPVTNHRTLQPTTSLGSGVVSSPSMEPSPMMEMPQQMRPEPAQQTASVELSQEDIELDRSIIQIKPQLEQAVATKKKPQELLQEMVASFGIDAVKQITKQITADRVTLALQRNPEGASSSLLKFQGKSWLRQLQAAAEKL